MSNKIKGVKIRDGQGNLSDEIPIGALAQNVDYDIQADTNVKQKIDAIETRLQNIDLTSVVYKGSGVNSVIVNVVGENPNLSNTASGEYSFAEGYYTKAQGANSHAEGSYSTAQKPNSHAEGYQTHAMGSSSHAEGNQTQASGGASHAEGQNTIATGVGSHAEGNSTRASGINSHAEGQGTVAQSNNQTVFGKYNKIDSASNYIEIAGNGTGTTNDTRSNARTLDWDGNEWIAGSIKVGGIGYSDSNAKTIATVDQVQTLVDSAIQNSEEIQGLVRNAVSEITPANLSLDADLQAQNKAAPAATVGNRLNEKIDKPNGVNQGLVPISDGQGGITWGEVSQDLNGYVQKPKNNNQPINGNNGQILKTNGDGTTSWINQPDLSGYIQTNDLSGYVQTNTLSGYIQKPKNGNQPTNGISGQILKTNGDDTTEWINQPDLSRYVQTSTLSSYIQKPKKNNQLTNGNNGQILSTDGQGNTSWIDPLVIGTGQNQAAKGSDLVTLQGTVTELSSHAWTKNQTDDFYIQKPQAEGNSGQILKTNGDGTTTWVNFIGNTAGTAVDAVRFNTLNTKVNTFFTNNEKFDPDLSKNFYGKKILFIGDSYCQGYSNDESARNYGWAKYCGDFLKITRTSSNLTAPLNMNDVGPTAVKTTTYSDRGDSTPNDKYEIICNGGARFTGENATGTNFKQLLIDAHDNKFVTYNTNNQKIPYNFTDIVVCGGYNDRGCDEEDIEKGIKDFCKQAQIYYGENINIYIGQIGKSTNQAEQSKIDTKVTPAYRSCNKYGAFYLSNVQDILIDSEISGDGYHPNESGNQTIGKAVALALLTRRNYLFISDARYIRQEWGWTRYCIDYMGLTHTFYNENVFAPDNLSSSRVDKSLFNDCQIICDDTRAGSACFNENLTNHITFLSLLQKAHNYKFRGYYFTDIVVCGGLAEQTQRDDEVPGKTTSEIIGRIQTGIYNFMQYKEKYYPYANVYIGHIGYSTNTNANNFIRDVSIPAYQSCGSYGATYLSNVQYWPTKSGIFEVEFVNGSGDKKGTAYANKKGLQSIGRAVASALLTGSAPLPSPEIKTFNENLKNNI